MSNIVRTVKAVLAEEDIQHVPQVQKKPEDACKLKILAVGTSAVVSDFYCCVGKDERIRFYEGDNLVGVTTSTAMVKSFVLFMAKFRPVESTCAMRMAFTQYLKQLGCEPETAHSNDTEFSIVFSEKQHADLGIHVQYVPVHETRGIPAVMITATSSLNSKYTPNTGVQRFSIYCEELGNPVWLAPKVRSFFDRISTCTSDEFGIIYVRPSLALFAALSVDLGKLLTDAVMTNFQRAPLGMHLIPENKGLRIHYASPMITIVIEKINLGKDMAFNIKLVERPAYETTAEIRIRLSTWFKAVGKQQLTDVFVARFARFCHV
jgi:hypothetical protein